MNDEIAYRLASRRRLAGLSQEALAEKLGYRLDRPYPAYLLDQTGP